jgi:DNA primase
MGDDLERLKQGIPLLDYLRKQNWIARPTGRASEVVGLCPLHPETRPSFYVNTRKDVFYCHGCGKGGDLIRFVELSRSLSFSQSLAYLDPQTPVETPPAVLEQAAGFYQQQLEHHPEALRYLEQRGLHDPALIRKLRIGYAPGGNLRGHLTAQGYSFDLLLRLGLIHPSGHDTFYQRVIFPCCQDGRIVNLYGRSTGADFAHRFLPGSKGGLFAWESVRQHSSVILVEGLFDLAVLWQAGFTNTTCALGTHLTPAQLGQLSGQPGRRIYILFDQDENQAGQHASQSLALQLQHADLTVAMVALPDGQDPNSYFVAGAQAADLTLLLQEAESR